MTNMKSDNLAKAVKIYQQMVTALRAKKWEFEEHEKDLLIISGCVGEDFPIQFLFRVDPERDSISFHTSKFARFSEEKLVDAAYATIVANHGLPFGVFDLDLNDGSIFYTMTSSYAGVEFSEDFFANMLAIAISTTDKYNDKFIMLSKGMINLQQFIESEG